MKLTNHRITYMYKQWSLSLSKRQVHKLQLQCCRTSIPFSDVPPRTLATRGYKREGPSLRLGGTEREARKVRDGISLKRDKNGRQVSKC